MHYFNITVINCFYLCSPADLVESMRQAELCDWALDSTLFTSLCDSLNRFFTQKGLISSSSGGPSFGQMAPPPINMPPTNSPSLASLTQPSPLIYSSHLHPGTGEPPLQSPRRTLTPHTQNQTAQSSATTSQPLTPNGMSTVPLNPYRTKLKGIVHFRKFCHLITHPNVVLNHSMI